MNQIYHFDSKEPPVLTEKMLTEELNRRRLKKQAILLQIASLFSCLAFALFAFFIAHDSLAVAVISCIAAGMTLLGNGVIGAVFAATFPNRNELRIHSGLL